MIDTTLVHALRRGNDSDSAFLDTRVAVGGVTCIQLVAIRRVGGCMRVKCTSGSPVANPVDLGVIFYEVLH